MSHAPVRKVVLPVAGLGTRVLPATKSIPKELLPVVDKPVLQYAIDEARDAGIEDFIFVTGRQKAAIEDYFDLNYELEDSLAKKKKDAILEEVSKTVPMAGNAIFTRQQRPLGLGHAIWCARKIVGNEPFAVSLPDVIVDASPSCLAQMVKLYNEVGGNIIAAEEVPLEDTSKYGILDIEDGSTAHMKIKGMVEKPAPSEAPSRLSILGRYIFQPELFGYLENQEPGAGNEIQVTDAMARMMDTSPYYAMRYDGTSYDCGDKVGFLKANVALALKRQDIEPQLRPILQSLLD